ncbi:unnamed protein product [Gongylonema pulchrum]|uniref:Uncharacterized protein n=1 Tax=Gongylonema pulchrum TaxID=637853 RepID=A0A183DVA5_9BILA|nr:unnamed protein product [Gongylonema pulchrum]
MPKARKAKQRCVCGGGGLFRATLDFPTTTRNGHRRGTDSGTRRLKSACCRCILSRPSSFPSYRCSSTPTTSRRPTSTPPYVPHLLTAAKSAQHAYIHRSTSSSNLTSSNSPPEQVEDWLSYCHGKVLDLYRGGGGTT